MRKFEADVNANYAHPENREEEADAILLDIEYINDKYSDESEYMFFAGISPTEARDLATKLNREADAFDEREKARQEAKKYPQEDGWYLVGPRPYQLFDGVWLNGGIKDDLYVKSRIEKYGYKKMTVED
jgi:hypothetical protein